MKMTDKHKKLNQEFYDHLNNMSYKDFTDWSLLRAKKRERWLKIKPWLIVLACLLPFTLLVVALIIKYW